MTLYRSVVWRDLFFGPREKFFIKVVYKQFIDGIDSYYGELGT